MLLTPFSFVLLALLGPQSALLQAPLSGSSGARNPLGASQTPVSEAQRTRVERNFGRLPLYFVPNQGQVDDSRVAFTIKGAEKTLFFTPTGVTFTLRGTPAGEESDARKIPPAEKPVPSPRWGLKLDFLGADPHVRPVGEARQEAVFSYFKGREEDWRTAIPSYGRIVYHDLWPGIDLVYSGSVNALKYEFVVHPGADPREIRLAYRGISDLKTTETGALQVFSHAGGFEDGTPVAWQEIQGEKRPVSMRYRLGKPTEEGAFPYGFELGSYDPAETLVLDPVILVYCGYIGGTSTDDGLAIAVDASGNAYVTGDTFSDESTFPVTVGPDLTFNGSADAFVARINAQGTALDYCGYIGGNFTDVGEGIAVDAAGNAYVAGRTDSKETTFPVTVGPDLTYNGGNQDAFVARVNAQGTALDYCGYIGGDKIDSGDGIAVDNSGNAYVVGSAQSTQTTFPVTVGPDLTQNGNDDAFVARVNAQGTALDYCGYIGGNKVDLGHGIAVDGSGNAYVVGNTQSNQNTFPETVGPDLTLNGLQDGFVARVNAQGTALDYCGYIGGDSGESASGIAVDGSGNAYVTGVTGSDESSFPVIVGPDLTFNGQSDVFVARINAQGTAFDYCGFIGGVGVESGAGIAVDSQGRAYLVGRTQSEEDSFPVIVGPDLTFNSTLFSFDDAFVGRVNAQGTALDYCGYIGGKNIDFGMGIAADDSGNAYVIGKTVSDESSFPVTGGPDLTYNGGWDTFVGKVHASTPILTFSGSTLSFSSGGTIDYAIAFPDVDAGASYQILLSAHGTGPTVLHGLSIPLTRDALFQASRHGRVPSLMTGFQGVLDANGEAAAKVAAPPGPPFVLPLKLAGHPVRLHLAVINSNFDLSSEPVLLLFTL